jgi:hypothetical protein
MINILIIFLTQYFQKTKDPIIKISPFSQSFKVQSFFQIFLGNINHLYNQIVK